MTANDVRKMIAAACAAVGGQAAWARQIGVSQQYLNDVLRRRRDPGPSVLRAVGVEKVESYRPVRRPIP